MTWTTEKPTELGWYWWRNLEQQQPEKIVQVSEWPSKCARYVDRGWGKFSHLDTMDGEWAGPIPEPTEREEW